MADSTSTTTCANCRRSDGLKRCAKCQKEWYCSRDCQKARWKIHKRSCSNSKSSTPSSPKRLSKAIDKPFNRLCARTWLHDLPEQDVYHLLIDSFRLRLDDNYTFDHHNTEGSVYAGDSHSLPAFLHFLSLAEKKPELLPPWWSAEKTQQCITHGMRLHDDDNWSSLGHAVEKHDIIKHYGDEKMPMQMRMFAEQVYERGPGGQSGMRVMEMMATVEDGGGDGPMASILNFAPGWR